MLLSGCSAPGPAASEDVGTERQKVVISNVTVTLTRFYIGNKPIDLGLYKASVNVGPVGSSADIWDCVGDPVTEGLGTWVPFPEGLSSDHICDPPMGGRQDIGQLKPRPGQTVIVDDKIVEGTTQIPVLIDIRGPLGIPHFEWRFSVDALTGAVTANPSQGNPPVVQETVGTDTCARNHDDWMVCWKVDTGPVGPGRVPFPWDLALSDPTDPRGTADVNNFRNDPRWNWQTQANAPAQTFGDCAGEPCTSQPTTLNRPDQTVPLTGACSADAFGKDGVGHRNWNVATYSGPLKWEGHSLFHLIPGLEAIGTFGVFGSIDSPDDDYNINMDTFVTNGHESGSTAHNDKIHLEFKASETIDHFDATPYWAQLHAEVDADSPNPHQINGKDAIAIGLMGLDEEHDLTSELHPVFGLAIHSNDDPVNHVIDTWDIFGRNFGNEGFCSDDMEYLVSPAGDDQPVDLSFRLPRPAGVPQSTTPTVSTNFYTGAIATLKLALTRFYIGKTPDMGLYTANVSFGSPFSSSATIWDCTGNPVSEGLGSWVPFPEGLSSDHICDPPSSSGKQDIGQLSPRAGQTLFSYNQQPTSPAQLPVSIEVRGPHGAPGFTWRFNVDPSTGAMSGGSGSGPLPIQLVTVGADTCARDANDWMVCWNLQRLPSPPATVDVFVNSNQDAYVTIHLPPPPLNGWEGQSQSGEIRINWTGGPPPPPPTAKKVTALAAAAPAAADTDPPEDTEELLGQVASQLTVEQRAVFAAMLPKLRVGPTDTIAVPAVVKSGLPPQPSASPTIRAVNDPRQRELSLGVVRALCGALAGQSPTGEGSCASFLPGTVLTHTGTVGPNGWFTTPVTVTLTAVDAGGVGIDHTEYSFDGEQWLPYSAPFVAPEGPITIFYRSVDSTGRVEQPAQQASFKIDTIAPASSANATASGPSVSLAFTVTDAAPGSGPAGLFSISKASPTPVFTLGASGTVQSSTPCTNIEYWGQDLAGNVETAHHHTADSKPPVLTPPPNVATSTCSTSTTVTVGQATATDECTTVAPPTGLVIATNNLTLAHPVPVIAGQVNLGIGSHTIQWTATDGTNSVSLNQTVVVGTKIQASKSFLVDDRAALLTRGGGFAAVLNSGSGPTSIGNSARTGPVLSVGPVRVLHGATVTGDVTSQGTASKDTDATVTGSINQFQSVSLPPLGSLPAFPSPTGGSFTVDGGSRTIRPGSYSTSSIVNGGTLILQGGDYFFQTLTINSNVTVRVTPTTRIFVRDSLTFRSPFRASSGTAVQPIFLGFAGTTVVLETEFDGTFLAPSASASLGIGNGATFSGSFMTSVLEIRPGSSLVCL